MKRREFIAGLGSVAAGSTFSAYADDAAKTLGLLLGGKPDDQLWQLYLRAFFQQLRSLGWTEGGNLRTEYRWAFGDPDRMRIGARELVAQTPHAILAGTAPTVPFLQHETQTIPIVFVLVIDPVALGYVASLSKPGANVTGFTNFEPSMGSKWLELLKEIAPGTKRVGYMFHPDLDAAFAGILINSIQAASSSMAIEITPAPVRSEQDIDAAMASFSLGGGMIVLPGNFAALQRGPITSLAARHRVPVVYPFDVFAAGGGLMSYGTVAEEEFRSAAKYMDRILNGTKPSDLPVQAPTKFKLVINLKTAKALGLAVPPTLLARADEVIE